MTSSKKEEADTTTDPKADLMRTRFRVLENLPITNPANPYLEGESDFPLKPFPWRKL